MAASPENLSHQPRYPHHAEGNRGNLSVPFHSTMALTQAHHHLSKQTPKKGVGSSLASPSGRPGCRILPWPLTGSVALGK